MNYVDIIYDNPNNDSFKIKIENIQYKACIAITWAIQGTSLEYLYHELGLEFLETRRWYRKLIFFHKIVNGATTRYLTSYLNTNENPVYNTRASDQNKIRWFRARIEHFRQSFFPVCVNEWYKLDSSPIEAKSIKHFKSMFKEFFNVKQRSLFAIHDPVGVELLTRLRLKFSHLNEHAFRHNFKYASSPMCDCGSETKTTDHFFLRCPFFAENRQKLLNNLFKIDVSLKKLNDEIISDILLFGSDKYKDTVNKKILFHTNNFIKTTKRFERPQFFWLLIPLYGQLFNFSSSFTFVLKAWCNNIACSRPTPPNLYFFPYF